MEKPQTTLTQLEEEPVTALFGATYTEIIGFLKMAILSTIVVAVILSIFITWEIAAIAGILFGALTFWILGKSKSKKRADKPLYYHKHLKKYKTNKFIQPAKVYQRERTNESQK